MALDGNIIAMAKAGNPATINYAMFCASFSMVSLFYLFPASINNDWSFHPIIMVVLDLLNMLFFLTNGLSLAARLECHSCSNHVRFPPPSCFGLVWFGLVCLLACLLALTSHFRNISCVMRSPMDLFFIKPNGVVKHKPLLLSFGSVGSDIPFPSSCLRLLLRNSMVVLLSICVIVLLVVTISHPQPLYVLEWPRCNSLK